MNKLIALGFLALAAACGAPPDEPPAATQAPAAALEIQDAWAAPTPGGVDVSSGYLTLANGAPEGDLLLSASSPRAQRVEMHEMSMDGGVMRMRAVEGGLAVGAGETLRFGPGGMHLMFIGVSQPFVAGEAIAVTLTFERAGVIETTLIVRRNGAP